MSKFFQGDGKKPIRYGEIYVVPHHVGEFIQTISYHHKKKIVSLRNFRFYGCGLNFPADKRGQNWFQGKIPGGIDVGNDSHVISQPESTSGTVLTSLQVRKRRGKRFRHRCRCGTYDGNVPDGDAGGYFSAATVESVFSACQLPF